MIARLPFLVASNLDHLDRFRQANDLHSLIRLGKILPLFRLRLRELELVSGVSNLTHHEIIILFRLLLMLGMRDWIDDIARMSVPHPW